jgi:hypothetical protein
MEKIARVFVIEERMKNLTGPIVKKDVPVKSSHMGSNKKIKTKNNLINKYVPCINVRGLA